MRPISAKPFASIAVAALLSLTGAALAQSSQAPAPAASGPQSWAPSGHPGAGRNAEERVEQRIKELHGQLRITPAENPQWDQFAQAMRENAREMTRSGLSAPS